MTRVATAGLDTLRFLFAFDENRQGKFSLEEPSFKGKDYWLLQISSLNTAFHVIFIKEL